MKKDPLKPGSVWGGILLVSGSCIGAGMLALPILTGLSGFFPSLFTLFLAWSFMMFTGLLLVEMNGWFFKEVNFISMAGEALGGWGRALSWISYLFLFYSLLVAYASVSGSVFSQFIEAFFHIHIPAKLASILFTLFFGYLIYLGTRPVDLVNRVFMFGLIGTYCGMIFLGIFRVQGDLLLHVAPKWILLPLPVLITSFGFQNMIPSLTTYMKGDLKRVKLTILGGSLLTLFVYLVWSILVLGVVPFGGENGILASYHKGDEATKAIHAVLGSSSVNWFAQGFAFFAIVTSFVAQGLTLTHFLADGFKISTQEKKGKFLTVLALLPPLLFALYNPEIFFKAMSLAGGIFAMILFGLLPITMAWVGRYRKKLTSNYHVVGGKGLLIVGFCFAIFVMLYQLIHLF